jgi:hypothetical protein
MNTAVIPQVSFNAQSSAYRIAEASQLLSRFMPVSRPEIKYKDNWLILQALYASAPDRFVVNCGVHQNAMSDKLHFSVSVKMNDVINVPMHFNGHLTPNGGFFISEVTRRNGIKQTETIFETAERLPTTMID